MSFEHPNRNNESMIDVERDIMSRPSERNTTNLDLQRMKMILDIMGHPEQSFRVIHITGTNGKGSTARMTEAMLEHHQPARVLEIGTGSGYQAAVLAALVPEVYSVERIDELLRNARRRFRRLGLDTIRTRHDDGSAGWAAQAPFDAILVTAAAPVLDPALLDQLAPDGVLVAPVGTAASQRLLRIRRTEAGLVQDDLGPVVFVPLLGGLA